MGDEVNSVKPGPQRRTVPERFKTLTELTSKGSLLGSNLSLDTRVYDAANISRFGSQFNRFETLFQRYYV